MMEKRYRDIISDIEEMAIKVEKFEEEVQDLKKQLEKANDKILDLEQQIEELESR